MSGLLEHRAEGLHALAIGHRPKLRKQFPERSGPIDGHARRHGEELRESDPVLTDHVQLAIGEPTPSDDFPDGLEPRRSASCRARTQTRLESTRRERTHAGTGHCPGGAASQRAGDPAHDNARHSVTQPPGHLALASGHKPVQHSRVSPVDPLHGQELGRIGLNDAQRVVGALVMTSDETPRR